MKSLIKLPPAYEHDEVILKDTFTELGFDVKFHQNLTAAEMKSTVKAYSAMEHTGAFFLIISSHGGEGDVVYGTDGGTVAVHDLQERFYATNCPSLAGIPKVFVIDASRGMEKERIHRFTPKVEHQSLSTNNTMGVTNSANCTMQKCTPITEFQEIINVFNSADIMTIFASTRNNVAGYDDKKGSLFIQAFAKVLKEASADKNLTDMIKIVHRKIQLLKIQIPQIESTFCKSYYITRFV